MQFMEHHNTPLLHLLDRLLKLCPKSYLVFHENCINSHFSFNVFHLHHPNRIKEVTKSIFLTNQVRKDPSRISFSSGDWRYMQRPTGLPRYPPSSTSSSDFLKHHNPALSTQISSRYISGNWRKIFQFLTLALFSLKVAIFTFKIFHQHHPNRERKYQNKNLSQTKK